MKEYKKKKKNKDSLREVVTLDELGRQCTNVHLLNDGMHAKFQQPRQKLTLCTGLPSSKVSRCTRQLRCQTTSNELRVV